MDAGTGAATIDLATVDVAEVDLRARPRGALDPSGLPLPATDGSIRDLWRARIAEAVAGGNTPPADLTGWGSRGMLVLLDEPELGTCALLNLGVTRTHPVFRVGREVMELSAVEGALLPPGAFDAGSRAEVLAECAEGLRRHRAERDAAAAARAAAPRPERAALVGLRHGDVAQAARVLRAMGPKPRLGLAREPGNPYDAHAVAVTVARPGGGAPWRIGHLARADAARVASRVVEGSTAVADGVPTGRGDGLGLTLKGLAPPAPREDAGLAGGRGDG